MENTAEITNTYTYDMTGIHIANQNETVSEYLKDTHGNVIGKADQTGNIMSDKFDYTAFGINVENTPDPFGYCGEYYDEETNLIYLRNRYYDSTTGRFITEDPAQDGLNWYSYCGGNPVMMVDSWGLFDYNTRLQYNPHKYSDDVKVLQNELAWKKYLSKDDRTGYFDDKTLKAVNRYKADMGFGNTGKDAGVVGKQTWESLGLIYRTKDDINAGITIYTEGSKQYKNVTTPLNSALYNQGVNAKLIDFATTGITLNGKVYIGELGRAAWFVSQVNHGQPWDIKREAPWNQTIGRNTYPGFNAKVYYHGQKMTPEELGNYTYGYIGHALGYNLHVLNLGSWVAAGLPVSGEALTNEYKDRPMIKSGFNAY